jgi:hypothetical protein
VSNEHVSRTFVSNTEFLKNIFATLAKYSSHRQEYFVHVNRIFYLSDKNILWVIQNISSNIQNDKFDT